MTRPLALAAILALAGCADQPAPMPFSHCVNLHTGEDWRVVRYEVVALNARITISDGYTFGVIDSSNRDQWECF